MAARRVSSWPVVNAASELVGVVSHDEHHGHNLHDDDKPYRSFHRCITLLNPNHGLPARYCPPLADKHPAVPMIELNLSSKPVDCDAIGLVVDQTNSTYRIVPRGDGSPSGRRTASPPRPTRTPSEDALGPPNLKRQDTDASFGALSPIKPLGTRVDPEARRMQSTSPLHTLTRSPMRRRRRSVRSSSPTRARA